MDCSNNKEKPLPCRVQMPMPPCMDTNCSCGSGAEPLRPMNQGACHTAGEARTQRVNNAENDRVQYHHEWQNTMTPSVTNMNGWQNTMTPSVTNMNEWQNAMMPSAVNMNEVLGSEKADSFQVSRMPIAMAYVPWQKWCQTYPMEQGFQRGTIFPELDFPFVMGRCRR